MMLKKGDFTLKKRVFSLILALVFICSPLFLLSACGKGDGAEVIEGFKNITKDFEDTDKLVDFKFYVPDHWIVDMSTGVIAAKYSEDDPSNITVSVFSISEDIEKLFEKMLFEYEGDEENKPNLIDACFNYYLEGLNEIFTDFKLESSNSSLLDGKPAKKYVYTAKLLKNEYKYLQVFCVKDDNLYVITFTSTANRFNTHQKVVEQMLGHFKFDK